MIGFLNEVLASNQNDGGLYWDIKSSLLSLDKIAGFPVHELYSHLPKNNTEHTAFSDLVSWKTIALVWNSPILDGWWYGADIDDHDIVIRMNSWIINHTLDAENTWCKTDIWSAWSGTSMLSLEVNQSLSHISDSLKAILIMIPDKSQIIHKRTLHLYIYLKFLSYSNVFFQSSNLFMDLVNLLEGDLVDSTILPSTWLRTMNALMESWNFSEISLYGFSFNTKHRILPEYKGWVHDFDKEREIIMWVIEDNDNINIYQ